MKMPTGPDETDQALNNSDATNGQAPLVSGDDETTPALNTLGQQIVEALQGLHTLSQLALAESTARHEADHQINRLARSLSSLAGLSVKATGMEADLKAAWHSISTDLTELAMHIPDPLEEDEEQLDEALILSEQEISRRLGVLRSPTTSEASPVGKVLRRVLVASLESGEETPMLVNQATTSFSPLEWSVTNLGANVPIMALTGNVMETRPSVLALVMGQGQYLAETIRLIGDLKRQLFGMRIIAVGPALLQPTLAERLKVDLFSGRAEKASAVCEQLFSPLTRLGEPLHFSMDVDKLDETPDNDPDEAEIKQADSLG